ncbi:MAG: phage capsid protein [Pseudoxanthomonas spadix]|nr:MAG: phage capsid protein [Pseudoxanthomonas spadix]
MATRPFPVDARLTAIAIAFRNPDASLIADDVLPRTPTGAEFKWKEYDLAEGFTVPDTKVGRKSMPNEVEFSHTEHQDKVEDHGLDDVVPNEDIDDGAENGTDPLGDATSYLTGLVDLGREARAASIVFNAANHNNKITLAAGSRWDDEDVDAEASIADALDTPIIRPNVAVFGQTTWTKLRRSRSLVVAIKGTLGKGSISRQEFADHFELQKVLVGSSFINTAKRGQAVSMSRVWGKHAAFIYQDRTAGPQQGLTYGFTAVKGSRIAGQINEPKIGLSGSVRVRSGERLKELVVAKDLSYFFQTAVN